MAVGDPRKVRYPTYPWSRKAGLHMQSRGTGVRFKMPLLTAARKSCLTFLIFFFHPVITLLNKNLIFVQPLLIVLIFLTGHFFQSFFRLSGVFRPEFITEINRRALGISVYMAERSCLKCIWHEFFFDTFEKYVVWNTQFRSLRCLGLKRRMLWALEVGPFWCYKWSGDWSEFGTNVTSHP